jgi:hypothetical protein
LVVGFGAYAGFAVGFGVGTYVFALAFLPLLFPTGAHDTATSVPIKNTKRKCELLNSLKKG